MNQGRKIARRGFSLPDLIAVLVMVVLLAGLALPGCQKAQQQAREKDAEAKLEKIVLAVHESGATDKRLPPAYGAYLGMKTPATIHVHLLPFEGEEALHKKILEKGLKDLAEEKVDAYRTAEDPSANEDRAKGVQNFAANLRVFSDFGLSASGHDLDLEGDHPCSRKLGSLCPDGLSTTMLFATKYAVCGAGGSRYGAAPTDPYAAFFAQATAKKAADPSDATATYQLQPGPKECRHTPLLAQSFSDSGLLVGMGDAAVRLVSPKVDAKVWNLLVDPADGVDLKGLPEKAPRPAPTK